MLDCGRGVDSKMASSEAFRTEFKEVSVLDLAGGLVGSAGGTQPGRIVPDDEGLLQHTREMIGLNSGPCCFSNLSSELPLDRISS